MKINFKKISGLIKKFLNSTDADENLVKESVERVVTSFTANTKGNTKAMDAARADFEKFAEKLYRPKIIEPMTKEVEQRASKLIKRVKKSEKQAVEKGIDTAVDTELAPELKAEVETMVGDLKHESYESIYTKIRDTHRNNVYREKLSTALIEQEAILGSANDVKEGIFKKLKLSVDKTTGVRKYRGKDVANMSVEDLVNSLHGKDLRYVTKQQYISVIASRAKSFKSLTTNYKTSAIASGVTNVYGNIDLLYRVSRDNNFKGSAKLIEGLFKHVESAERYVAQSARFGAGVESVFKQHDVKAQDKIVQYIESAVSSKMKAINVNTKKGINLTRIVDKEAFEATGLSLKQLETANVMINANRVMFQAEADLKANVFKTLPHFDDFIEVAKDLNLTAKMWRKRPDVRMGDVGSNYWHRSPNEAGWKKIESTRTKVRADNGGSVPSHLKARVDDKFGLTVEERLPRSEELRNYYNQATYRTTQRIGDEQLAMVGASFSEGLIGSGLKSNTKVPYEVLSNVRMLFENVRTNLDNIYAKPTKLANDSVYNVLSNTAYGIADVNTAAALVSPVFWGFNALQAVTNTIPFHGLKYTMSGYKDLAVLVAKNSPQIAKNIGKKVKQTSLLDVVTNGKYIDASLEVMLKNKMNPLQRKVVNDYAYVYASDVLMQNMYSTNTHLKNAMNIAGTLFKLSDAVPRFAVVLGVTKQAEHALAPFRGKVLSKDIPYLTKKLHLDEFKNLEKNSLVNKLLGGKHEDFISEYAARSVNMELFNYSTFGSPNIINAAKKHQGAARAMRFMSWGFRYTDYLAGVKRSYEAGDKDPLRKLFLTSAVWLGGFGTMAANTEEDGVAHDIAMYGLGRLPAVSPVMNMMGMADRSLGGMMTPAIADLAWIPANLMNEGVKLVADESPFNYTVGKLNQSVKTQPLANKLEWVYNGLF